MFSECLYVRVCVPATRWGRTTLISHRRSWIKSAFARGIVCIKPNFLLFCNYVNWLCFLVDFCIYRNLYFVKNILLKLFKLHRTMNTQILFVASCVLLLLGPFFPEVNGSPSSYFDDGRWIVVNIVAISFFKYIYLKILIQLCFIYENWM